MAKQNDNDNNIDKYMYKYRTKIIKLVMNTYILNIECIVLYVIFLSENNMYVMFSYLSNAIHLSIV